MNKINDFVGLVTLYRQSDEYFLYRASTQASIEASLTNHLLPYFGTIKLNELDTSLIESWLNTLKYTPPIKGGCNGEHLSECTSQQILDTNHKKIYNKKLSVSQISVRNATCDIELASDSLTNKLDAVH